MKATLINTTVKFTAKKDFFTVYKGKGTGSAIAAFKTLDEAVKFDKDFNNLEYKFITRISDNEKGGAYFYKGTVIMFGTHPFGNDFKIID